jgi:hypothetical protein
MEAVWGAVLSFLFILAALSGYNVTGPWTSEKKEQLEKQLKEQKEDFEKKQKEQKEKSEKSENKQKSEQPDKVRHRRHQRRKAVLALRIARMSGDFVNDVGPEHYPALSVPPPARVEGSRGSNRPTSWGACCSSLSVGAHNIIWARA